MSSQHHNNYSAYLRQGSICTRFPGILKKAASKIRTSYFMCKWHAFMFGGSLLLKHSVKKINYTINV